jgi:(1->4)-alpha-D-glucan 1-alpha-D-glucosylmutase
VTAKGIEDTVLYIYNRLLSLNEVGVSPDVFGLWPDRLHGWMDERQTRWPHALSATSTHDTKRGEDVRARLHVLSEMPGAWKQALRRWSRLNRKRRIEIDGQQVPDRNEEYFLYQILIGALPFDEAEGSAFHDRLEQYVIKSLREAKVHSTWIGPNEAYEQAVAAFARAILKPSPANAFLHDFLPFQERIAQLGLYNSLSQVVLKVAAPGVPDFYQGTELWDLSLVDPDNRRPVDYTQRARLLDELDRLAACDRTQLARELVRTRTDGRVKLHAVATGLRFRRDHATLFAEGGYAPVQASGDQRDHVFAFARRTAEEEVIAVVPRLVAQLLRDSDTPPVGPAVWTDTTLHVPDADRTYHHLFTGQVIRAQGDGVRVAEVLADFPVALLARIS